MCRQATTSLRPKENLPRVGAGDRGARARGSSGRAGLRQAVRGAAEERHGRCRCQVGGSKPPDHAVRRRQDSREAGGGVEVRHSRPGRAAANADDQRPPRAHARKRHRDARGHFSHGAASSGPGRSCQWHPEAAAALCRTLLDDIATPSDRIELLDEDIRARARRDEDGADGRALVATRQDQPSLAAASLPRQTPEVGAECVSSARSDLSGGRRMKPASLPDGP